MLDESTSIKFAHFRFVSLLPVLAGRDPNMGLYYILLNFWVKVFGESEAAVRGMSALFGALAVSAIYLLGARLFGRTVGLVAGLLLVLNAFVVQYAQTARSYALLVLLVTLSSYFLVVELERPSKHNRIWYMSTSTMAVYAHYFAAYVLVVHLGAVVVMRGRGAWKREWLGMAAAILLLCAPEVIIVYRAGAADFIGWIGAPSLKDIGPVLVDLAGGSRLLLLLLLAGGFVATMFAIRERRYCPVGFVAAWLTLPIALCFAVSSVRPMFLSYYLIICVPALILFGTAALARIHQPIFVGVLVAPLVWLSATQLAAFYGSDRGENWRDATQYVLSATRPGDAIVFYPDFAHKPFDYYQRRSNGAAPTNLTGEAPVETQQRVWLVIRESDAAARFPEIRQVQSSLRGYRLIGRREFRRVEVDLYAR